MSLCTPDLATHPWRCVTHLDLGLADCDGFTPVFLVWRCPRCDSRVWADGVVHTSTPPLSPAQWEALTARQDPWQAMLERLRTEARQTHHVHRLLRASVPRRRE